MQEVKIRFRKNLELDSKNWWGAVNQQSYGYDFSKTCPANVKEKIKGKKFPEVRNYLKKKIVQFYNSYEKCKKLVSYLKENKEKIIKILERIHNKKFPVKFVDIYYTSYPRSPYGIRKDSFWIQINGMKITKHDLLEIVVHELMHLFFHKYYWDFCKKHGLKNDEIHDIKEAFTILINSEFKGLIKKKDFGYPDHKKIREFIEKEWKKNKNFDKVLKYTINFYKNAKENRKSTDRKARSHK